MVCVVPAQFAHAGWLVIAFVPFDDAPHVRAGRVVTDAWLVVPAGPGAPTWTWMNVPMRPSSAVFAAAAVHPLMGLPIVGSGDGDQSGGTEVDAKGAAWG